MKYLRPSEELAPHAGFLHWPEQPGFTTIVAGPPEIDGPDKTGSELNHFPCERIQMSIHRWPPVKHTSAIITSTGSSPTLFFPERPKSQ